MFKNILSVIIALVVAFIFLKIITFALKISFAVLSTMLVIGLLAVISIPLFVIVRKKLLK